MHFFSNIWKIVSFLEFIMKLKPVKNLLNFFYNPLLLSAQTQLVCNMIRTDHLCERTL